MILNDRAISEDAYGFVCLTDMWIAAGRPVSQTPARWRQNPGPKALIAAFEKKVAQSYLKENSVTGSALYSKSGRGGLTFAHASVALTYAKSLSPELELAVNDLFLFYKTDAVLLALDILDGLTEQAEYDQLRVTLRQLVKDHNKLSAQAAQAAGVKNFEAYNRSGLNGLYGGMTKAELLRHKKLPDDANHLDHAGHEELASNYFKATQAEAKLRRDAAQGVKGQTHANKVHKDVGIGVRETIRGFGGTMPEDEPALDHIRHAEKRLKAVTPKGLAPPSVKKKSP
jgi:DNA-damage-inducible protein D